MSYTNGVYNRNTHGQEILLRPTNITWRALGGSIDLYFFSGPTIKDVTASWQKSCAGLPAMQQYFMFGYHQCRWGYRNWTEVADVVNRLEEFEIPMDTIWHVNSIVEPMLQT